MTIDIESVKADSIGGSVINCERIWPWFVVGMSGMPCGHVIKLWNAMNAHGNVTSMPCSGMCAHG